MKKKKMINDEKKKKKPLRGLVVFAMNEKEKNEKKNLQGWSSL